MPLMLNGTPQLGDKENTLKQYEGLNLYGHWKLTARHIKTGELIVKEGDNLICTVGKNLVGDMLIDTAGYDIGLTYQAIGTSNTAVTAADTHLNTETSRKAITFKSRLVNVDTLTTFFAASECTYFIKEAGIFGHSTATATTNTGIIFSHWLVSFDNSGGTYDITIDYTLTIG